MTTNPRTLADELVAEIDEYRSGDDTLMTIPAGDIRALAQALRDAERRPNIRDCMDPWVCCVHSPEEMVEDA